MMLLTATSGLYHAVLGIHIVAWIAVLAVALGYPLAVGFADAIRKRPPVYVHRLRVTLSRFVVNPGLVIGLAAGIYLAADLHQFSRFYVAWGFVALVAIGGLEGGLISRGHRRQAELAAAGDAQAVERYQSQGRFTNLAEWVVVVILIVTAIIMFAKP